MKRENNGLMKSIKITLRLKYSFIGLTVDLCEKVRLNYILRGLRDSHDFKYEKNIAQTNKKLK